MPPKPYKEIKACRICGNRDLDPLLSLGRQALTGVFPRFENEAVTSGPVDLVKCAESDRAKHCGLVQLLQSYDPAQMYGERYGYNSRLNPSMVTHLAAKAAKVEKLARLGAGDLVVDIGANDGTLLKSYKAKGPTYVGVDPTGEMFREQYPPHIELIADFFSAELIRKRLGGRRAKAVTSIAMFYDLESPPEFMAQVREVLANDGIWVMEQSYLPAMLAATAYDTICHEHLEYYGLRQIVWMARQAGLKVVDVEENDVNGGSFEVTLARAEAPYPPGDSRIAQLLAREHVFSGPKPYKNFAERVAAHREELLAFLSRARKGGKKVLGYGASTKGNVILQYCGLTRSDIPMIGEVNARKFGCFTPGTLIPIVSEVEAKAAKPDYLMVLPWHFKEFIVKKEAAYLKAGGKLFFPLPKPHTV